MSVVKVRDLHRGGLVVQVLTVLRSLLHVKDVIATTLIKREFLEQRMFVDSGLRRWSLLDLLGFGFLNRGVTAGHTAHTLAGLVCHAEILAHHLLLCILCCPVVKTHAQLFEDFGGARFLLNVIVQVCLWKSFRLGGLIDPL